ncbi:MAG: PKD domain-containing protein [Bacteroidia bacterium]
MQRLLLVFFLITCVSSLQAQLPANQPEQDCLFAIPVCQNVIVTPISYQGTGANANGAEINFASSCLNNGENNSVWYTVTPQSPGNLCFEITPTNLVNNYDWAVYNITGVGCQAIFTNPAIEVACNFDAGIGCNGRTGASGGFIGISGCPLQDNACIPVFAGETYVIAVNNETGGAAGHTIDFSRSTAIIIDNFPPEIESATFDCANNRITVRMDEPVDCGTVAPIDFVLTGPGGPYTVTAVSGVRCGTDPTEAQFDLTISPGFQGNGTYTISVADTILDNCGNMAVIGQGVNFRIISSPPALRFARNFCSDNTLEVKITGEVMCNSIDPADFTVTGPGGPYTVTIAQGIGCRFGRSEDIRLTVSPAFPANGFYTANLVGDLLDSCGNVSINSSQIAFVSLPQIQPIAAPDTICSGSPVTLDAGVTGPYRYQWTPANVRARIATERPTVSTIYTVSAIDTTTGCTFRGSVPVVVKPVPTARFGVTTPICASQVAIITFTGQANSGVGVDWDLDGAIITAGDTNTLAPLSVQWNTPGPKTISLVLEEDGCFSNVYTQTITVFGVPTASFSFASPVCVNDSMTLTYTGNATPASSYIWQFDGGLTSPSANGRQGPYNVAWSRSGTKTVCMQVQENGCVSNLTCRQVDVLDLPRASIASVADVCFDSGANSVSFTYNGTPGVNTYEWFFGPTASRSTATGPTPPPISFSTPGIKTVRMVVAQNGCISDTARVSFEVLRDPIANFSINTASGTVCAGDTVRVRRNGGSVSASEIYIWNFGQNANPAQSNLLDPGVITYSSGGTKVISLIVRHGPGCESRFADQVVIEDVPNFNAGNDVRFCEGTGGVQLNGTTNGGFPGYTWQWDCDASPSCGFSSSIVEDPTVNPTGLAPDTITYRGFATDAKGCRSNIDLVKVIIDAKPKVNAGPDVAICEDGPGVNLQGSLLANNRAPGPFAWEWRDAAGNVPPAGMTLYQQAGVYTRPAVTTLYSLVITDLSTGCNSEVTTIDPNSTVTVRVIPKPLAFAGPDTVVCLNDTLKLRGSAAGGEGNYTYAWTPNNPLVGYMQDPTLAETEISPFQSTTYTLVVTASGCTSNSDDVNVTVHTRPTVEAGDDKVICFGDSVILDGSASGAPQDGTGYTFTWTPSLGLSDTDISRPFAKPGITQTYRLRVESDFGCGSDEDDVTVTVQPVPVADVTTRDTVICAGSTVVLNGQHTWGGTPPGAPNVIYEWSPGNQIDGSNRLPVASGKPTETTLYTLTTTEGACSSEAQVLVTVSPDVEVKVLASDTVICSGETITLEAIGGLGNSQYTWSPSIVVDNPNAQTTSATPPSTLTYRVNLTEGACSANAFATVTVNPTPEADYFASETEGCAGLEVSFLENATNDVAYIWTFGDGSPVINEANPIYTFDTPGTFPVKLTVVGLGGCSDSITKNTIEISGGPVASFTAEPDPGMNNILYLPNAEVQFLNQSDNATEYLWDFGDGNYSREESPVYAYQEVGTYDVILTASDNKGCTSTDSLGTFDVRIPGLLIPNVFTPNSDGRNDRFVVQYEGGENFQVTVFDRWGKQYFETNNPNNYWQGTTTNGNDASEGVYFYTVRVGEKSYTGNVTLLR